jgi:DNA repair exonuclease SbcCD ATPase subunit
MSWTRTATPIYQDSFLTVSLEPNPAGDGQAQMGKDAQAISNQQLAATLRGLYARKNAGFLQSVIGSQPELVFRENELSLVARELQKGLRQASPRERVAFQLWRPRGKGREETSGAIYLRGSLLYMTLAKFRSPDFVTYKDAEYGSGTDFELLYEPSDAVVHRQQGFASRWLGGDSTEVIVDVQKVSGSMETTTAPPVPATVTVEALQQQIKVLTESNQDLRAKLKEFQERREQFQDRSSATSEELTRLRQELAELKQLLADKVLELNRLKGKSGETGKGEAAPSR